jgi:hypothetical protein
VTSGSKFPGQIRHSLRRHTCATLLVPFVAGCQTLAGDRLTWPTVDYQTVSCADLAEATDILRKEINRLSAPRQLSEQEVAGAILYAPLAIYYALGVIPMAMATAAEDQKRLDEYRAKLSEVEEAMRNNGCPPSLSPSSDKPQDHVSAKPGQPAPSP